MNEYFIKDGEGRLWEIKTDAHSDVVAIGMKFLKANGLRRIVDIHNLLESYGHKTESNLIPQLNIDFEM